MSAPRIVRTKIRHVRRRPLTHEFSYRGYSWLVDLDALPTFPRPLRLFAEFRSADHGGLGVQPGQRGDEALGRLQAAGAGDPVAARDVQLPRARARCR